MQPTLDTIRLTIDQNFYEGEEKTGITQIAFTHRPAVKVKGVAFSSHETPLCFSDAKKMRIVAPAMIPSKIYRNDEIGQYYAEFTVEEIEAIHSEFMSRLNNTEKFNLEHNEGEIVPAYILECWLVGKDPKADRSFSEFGILVPTGTLMLVTQITELAYYEKLVASGATGYSIEGFLGMKFSETSTNIKNENMDMLFPDGEHTINDKIYVVADGKLVEIKDVVALTEDEQKEEPTTLAENPEVVETPEVVVETPEVPASLTEEQILTLVEPKFEEIYKMLADLKALVATEKPKEDPAASEKVMLSVHQRFGAAVKFTAENN